MEKRIYLNQMVNRDALKATIRELAKFQFASSVPFFPTKASLNEMLNAHVSSELRIAFGTIWDFCQQGCWQGDLFRKAVMIEKKVPENYVFDKSEEGVFHYTEKNIARMAGNIFRESFPNEKQSECVGFLADIKLQNTETGHYAFRQDDEIAIGFFWGSVKGDIFQTMLRFIEYYIPLYIEEISSVSIHSGIVFSEKIMPERNAVLEFLRKKGLPKTGWVEM
ncbi:MAG: hypothetical protein WAV31_00060 [Candidatus Moraniibacteriota bacterium]